MKAETKAWDNSSLETIGIIAGNGTLPVRFAKEAKLQNIRYFSDYKNGSFGKSTGLLIQGPELLARAVVVTDKQGIVRHIQVVPEVAELPDMSKAIELANSLVVKTR